MKPICLTVPYFTRLGDLISKHAFGAECFCVVVRDGSVLGVLSGEDPYGRWWYNRWVGVRRVVED